MNEEHVLVIVAGYQDLDTARRDFGTLTERAGLPPLLPTTTRFVFEGDVQNIRSGMVPRVFGRSYSIEARLQIPDGGAQGVIAANGDFIGGFALWIDEACRLHHTYS